VTVWLQVVAELSQPDEAGSLTDLGLRPGGRVKLIKSNTVVLENPLRFVHRRLRYISSSVVKVKVKVRYLI